MGYKLTRRAEDDIIQIFPKGIRRFGENQAIGYHLELEGVLELIAANPLIARERTEINPPVRVHPHKAHLIVYLTQEDNDVLIVRIRHGRENWESAAT